MKNFIFVCLFLVSFSLTFSACSPPSGGGGPAALGPEGDGQGDKDGSGQKPKEFSCGQGDVSNFGIVGGQVVQPESWLAKSTVYLVQDVQVHPDGSRSGFACTGTLIDKDMVITAAHCVDRVDLENDKPLYVYFTPQPTCKPAGDPDRYRMFAAAVKIHPDYANSSSRENARPRGDVALVRLERAALVGYQPLSFKDDFPNFRAKSQTWLAGYGKTTDYYEKDLQPAALRVTSVNTFPWDNGEWSRYAPSAHDDVIYFDQRQDRGACAGDSGGPALFKFNGRFYQIGVASVVADPSASSEADAKPCRTMSAYTNLYYYKTWLETEFAKMKGPFSKKVHLFE